MKNFLFHGNIDFAGILDYNKGIIKAIERLGIDIRLPRSVLFMDEMNYDNYTPDIYTLCDEEGKEQSFELIDTYEDEGNRYYAMVPYFEDPEDLIQSDGDLVILKSDYVDGEEMLVTIEDDDEYNRIGAIFLKRIEEMYQDMEDDCCNDEDCDCCDHHQS